MKRTILKLNIFSLLLFVAFFSGTNIQAQTSKTTTVTILHTNDTHSRIEALSNSDKKYPGRAGYVYRSAIVNKIRKEQKNTLLLDAGDFVQGTPYFNYYKGAIEVELMNRLGYVAATLGNHEFDLGVDHLALILKKAKFAIVNCNYIVCGTPLKKIIKPWIIVTVGDVKIGITGVGVNPEGLIAPENFKGITYCDPVVSVNKIAKLLKIDKKCDYVICLSHLGYQQPEGIPSDMVLVKKSVNIDVVIGGHTHTLLERPDSVYNSLGKAVYITQCGSMGVNLGRMDVGFQRR
jgi:5'-nucleotidase